MTTPHPECQYAVLHTLQIVAVHGVNDSGALLVSNLSRGVFGPPIVILSRHVMAMCPSIMDCRNAIRDWEVTHASADGRDG